MPPRLLTTTLLLLSCLWMTTARADAPALKTVHADGVTLHYTLRDAQSLAKEPEITTVAVAGFNHFTALFGSLPRDAQGKPYRELNIRVRHGEHLRGEADPGLVMLTWSDTKLLGHMNWKTLLLHELFHLWSGESFRYRDQREQWFNEGVSEFYAWQAATRLGIVTPNEALSIAALPIGCYHGSSNLGRISLRQAARDDRAKRENYFLVYHGGWTAAMLLDHDIRTRSGGMRSLDDLMRWLHANYPAQERRYDMEALLLGLHNATGLDYRNAFHDYIDGTETLPTSRHLDVGAALWAWEFTTPERENYRTLYRTLGIDQAAVIVGGD